MYMLPDPDNMVAIVIGLGHLFVVAFFIMFREWIVSRNTASSFEQKMYKISTFFILLSSGAALSFVLIYALRSAALSVSWPLFVILFICIFANEFVSTHSFRFSLDVGILLIAILFYIIFHFPLLLGVQNDITFAISIVVSIAISIFYIYVLRLMSETALDEAPRGYALAIGIPMFVGMLYFLNVLPAVPLSLKESGIYHNIVRTEVGEFIAKKEVEKNMNFFSRLKTLTYNLSPNDTGIYFFSSIDAPTKLSAPISHVWEYYDDETKEWIPTTTISFGLTGGREDGYRAYSNKENITEGLWRVTVKVDGNRIVGRVNFLVKKVDKVEVKEVKL